MKDKKKYPEGSDSLRVKNELSPIFPNILREITEDRLKKIGFDYGDFPRMFFVLNDETSFEMAYAKSEWYGYIIQFDGKIGLDRICIPKDLKTINDVKLIITALQ